MKATPGPLRPIELATGAVLGGVTIALSVVATFVPFATAVQVLAAIPMGIIAHRHRPRALLVATVSTSLVAFVAGGLLASVSVVSCAVLGGIVGDTKRRGRGLPTVLLASVVAGLVSALFAIGMLLVFSATRQLFFDAIRNTAEGLHNLAARASILKPLADGFGNMVDSILHYWWLWLGGSVAVGFVLSAVFAWFVLGAVLDRLAWLPAVDHLDAPDDDRPVSPLPVRLDNVGYRYPGTEHDALDGVDFSVEVGEFVAVVGHNGSGKSTLTRVLAGRPPTSGVVHRPGAAGLGRLGGTAVVLQRPESQLLGVLVADDVVWGLPEGERVDVDRLLAEVGLAGLGGRETASLSGGQQQRLAVAAALARRPQLLIADEATSMVDPQGRRDLVTLLAELPRRHPMAVVLVTHQQDEAAAADRVVHLSAGRTVTNLPEWTSSVETTPSAGQHRTPLLELREVRHTYLAGTPWATEALHGIDLTVHRGEGVLIVGGNGSGKSTLAWIMAGLTTPTSGSCTVAGKPTSAQLGKIGLAFQHSRLQLQRRTVGDEISSWGGGAKLGSGDVGRALDAVGLDRRMAGQAVDRLSGGQTRRVLLAGILASRPRLIVLDEPLAGLDPAGRRGIVELLGGLRRQGMTVVVISHDVEGMESVCDRTVRIADGRIVDAPTLIGGLR